MEPMIARTSPVKPDVVNNNNMGKKVEKNAFSNVVDAKMKERQEQTQVHQLLPPDHISIPSDHITKISVRMSHMLSTLHSGKDRLDILLNKLQSGNSITEADMITIQSVLLSTSREIEAVGKIVEHFVSGVKTTMQTQV